MFACKFCIASDRASDTIRVDLDATATPTDVESMVTTTADDSVKEIAPLDLSGQLETLSNVSEEDRQAAYIEVTDENAGASAAAVTTVQAEDEQAQKDSQMLQEVARLAEEAEQRALELDREREEAEAARNDHQRQLEEASQKRLQHLEQKQDKEKLAVFLKSHGYAAADVKRKVKLFGYKYPLHSAVKANDAEMVRILMDAGADPAAKNSSGQTPREFATKVDNKASHSRVIRALGGC